MAGPGPLPGFRELFRMAFPDVLQHEGAVFGAWRGEPAPLHFGDWQAEYAAFDTAACVLDAGARTYIQLSGPDCTAFLHRMCTNQVVGRQPGSGCEAFLLDAKGHVLAYVRILVAPESLLLETAAGQAEAILHHLGKYVVRDRVAFQDRSHVWHSLRVAGAGAFDVLGQLVSGPLPDQPLAHVQAYVAGLEIQLVCLRVDGRPCWQLVVPCEQVGPLWSAIRRLGARPCGRLAAEVVRIEWGEPEYGVDITADNLPQEVRRDAAAICTTKGCYLGQEVVARIDCRGHVNRYLVGLILSAREVPAVPHELYADGQPAGRITSAAFSPGLGATIALGYVRREDAQPGQRLDSPSGSVAVARLPLRP